MTLAQGGSVRWAALVALLAGMLGESIFQPGSAWAQATPATQVVTIPVDTAIPNPCTGELLLVRGTVHYLVHETTDAGGGTHYFRQGVFQGSAVGLTSGTQYQVINRQADPGPTNFTAGGAVTNTDVIMIQYIGPGPRNNFVEFIQHHITFNANGQLTALPVHVRTECR